MSGGKMLIWIAMQKSQCLKISKNVSLQITRTDAAFGGWWEACGAKLASLAFEWACKWDIFMHFQTTWKRLAAKKDLQPFLTLDWLLWKSFYFRPRQK